ncbi:MAG TPA: glycosyltransferase [Solirubrobacteraceae bacterium]|nr:glycosyltransferase [Solirubrobacteraceae bacterium]
MLNWLARYASVTSELALRDDETLAESVLDVGCGPHGLACALPHARFVGTDVAFPGPTAPGMIALRNDPGPLPFVDAAFDTVVCLDVLEHLPVETRGPFVAELARVAARRVLVACPSNDGAWGQEVIRRAYAQRGIPIPGWLSEHDEHGLPSPAAIRAACASVPGFVARPLPMANGMLATMATIADMMPEFAEHAAIEFRENRDGWLEAFASSRFGHSTRRGYIVERESPARALIDADDLPRTIWGAVCCPACRVATFEPVGPETDPEALRCPLCGYVASRDGTGAYDVRRSAPQPAVEQSPSPAPSTAHAGAVEFAEPLDLDAEPTRSPAPAAAAAVATAPAAAAAVATAPAPAESPGADLEPIRNQALVKLLLAPNWDQPREWIPAVATYLTAPPDGGRLLWLDATGSSLRVSTIYEMVAAVCHVIAGDAPFGEIMVMDAPFDRAGTIPVATAADVRERLGLDRREAPGAVADAETLVAQARAAKQLVDGVMEIAYRDRYLNAPDPWTSREPLVTVRIATWRKPRLLVERAIPSVLNGVYRNVELLVCSDGHDPETAAAVAELRDPRLRYMEMPARPTYPENRWSLWSIAGAYAANRMVGEARGSFVAPLCHDDAFTEDHIHLLLQAMAEQRTDFAYGQALMERPEGPWYTVGHAPLQHAGVTNGACLYSSRVTHVPLDTDCWLLEEPGDWNYISRLLAIGAKPSFVPRVVLAHFAERSVVGYAGTDTRTAEAHVSDLRHTGLSWLLDIPISLS